MQGTDDAPTVVRVRDLNKTFTRTDGSLVHAIKDVSLDVVSGEFLVLLGPSGCGKTTLLRSIAGLETADAGTIEIAGRPVFGVGRSVPPERREIGMIFQSYALWPHLTVADNVAFPLRSRKVAKSEIPRRVSEALDMVGIADLGVQFPGQISGGQQQRVALARALVARNGVILFDEPLSNVDAKVREQLRHELLEMQRDLKFAAIYVTHDQDEALTLATRIAVLGGGEIQQLASPREVYERPSNRYVADFVGTTNVIALEAGAARAGENWSGRTALGQLTFSASPEIDVFDKTPAPEADHVLVCRPERVRLQALPIGTQAGQNQVVGTVVSRSFSGPHTELDVAVSEAGAVVKAWVPSACGVANLEVGTQVMVEIPPQDLRMVLA